MRALLTLLCQYPYNPSNRDALSALLREVKDWPKTVKLINAHGIIALAAYNIKVSGLQNEIPGESMKILEEGYMKSVVRNAWLTERWKEVNEILNKAGIKHVLLKGMALEHTLYGSKGLRQMTDNDILVKPNDAFKAWTLLKQYGFTSAPMKSHYHEKIHFEIDKHLPRLNKEGYSIEVHYKLFEKGTQYEILGLDPFNHTNETQIHGAKVLILENTIHLCYLIDHFERHKSEGECQLRLYTDIKLLDKTSAINIPDHFILKPFQTKVISKNLEYNLILKSLKPVQKFCYVFRDIFPSVTWMKDRYGCSWMSVWFYYPLRLGKLLWLL